MSINDKQNLTKKDAADWFGVTVPTITRWIKSGRLPDRRNPGGQVRFSYRDLMGGGMEDGWTDLAGHVRVIVNADNPDKDTP